MSTEAWTRSGTGDCYRQAVLLAEELEAELGPDLEITIVHGLVTGTGGEAEGIRYNHAWVEVNRALCADRSQGGSPVTVPVGLYYGIGSVDPDETHRYCLEQAHRHMVDLGHYGPWRRGETTAEDSGSRRQ